MCVQNRRADEVAGKVGKGIAEVSNAQEDWLVPAGVVEVRAEARRRVLRTAHQLTCGKVFLEREVQKAIAARGALGEDAGVFAHTA